MLIHGIGEQRPMDTLRSFMAGIGLEHFYSKPDRLSENFELRRFSAGETSSRPPTDYYELYWAHHFDAGRLRDTLAWAARLLIRRPFWRHGPQLRAPIAVIQVTTVVLIAVLGWTLVDAVTSGGVSAGWERLRVLTASAAIIVNLVAGRFLTHYLADATRYLTPTPGNVKARNEIRAEGLRLLRELHEAGVYERVVLVGHSLGSVIGLDLLRLAWDELRHPDPALPQLANEARQFDQLVKSLPARPDAAQMATWQQAQHRLWRESRARGMRWLVTDFVTLGSPLAHASFLLDGRKVKFHRRQIEREYPICPPADDGGIFYSGRYALNDGSPRNALVAHHGAPFAVTRWSNAYFPVRRWYGDPVGGPLAPEFGRGIRDVSVRAASRQLGTPAELFLLAHTHYWRREADPDASTTDESVKRETKALDRSSGTRVAHRILVDFLQLDIKRATERFPAPTAPQPRSSGMRPLSGE